MKPMKYVSPPGEDLQQGLYSFNRTDTLVLVEANGNRSYDVSFFPSPGLRPSKDLAQRLVLLPDSRKRSILADSEIVIWLANQTRGKPKLGIAVNKSLSYRTSESETTREVRDN